MNRPLIRRIGMSLPVLAALSICSVGTAMASDKVPTDDEYYCRFFVDNIKGDVDHVQEVTSVRGFYWLSDDDYDVYFFTWRPEVGAVLEFRRDDHLVASMRGTIGFDPQVNYWQCDEVKPGN